MMGDNNRDTLLKKSISLLIFISLEHGVHGQCSTPPANVAVYEGSQDTTIFCNSPTKVSWTLRPTSDQLGSYTITNYNDVVAPAYANLFGVNSTGLNIKTAQGLATIPRISTAGLYIILISGSTTKYGAKLIVVREPLSCNCIANSTKIQINCSLTYADSNYNPISAKMTWTTGDGSFLKNDTPTGAGRMSRNGYWTSTSTITVDVNDTNNYACDVTFGAPTSVAIAYVATNAPEFSATCNPSFCGKTTTTSLLSTTAFSVPISTAEMGSTNVQRATTAPTGGLSEGGKIGIGVGIGIGAAVALAGIVFVVLCRRYECVKRTKTADEKTNNGTEGNYEINRSDGDSSITQPYQPLSVLSVQNLNTEVFYESIA